MHRAPPSSRLPGQLRAGLSYVRGRPELATLVAVGVAGFTFTTTASTTLLLSVAPAMRGRVSGLHMLMVLGGAPLAAPSLGALAGALGARAPIITGGVISALAAIGAWVLLRRKGDLLIPGDTEV